MAKECKDGERMKNVDKLNDQELAEQIADYAHLIINFEKGLTIYGTTKDTLRKSIERYLVLVKEAKDRNREMRVRRESGEKMIEIVELEFKKIGIFAKEQRKRRKELLEILGEMGYRTGSVKRKEFKLESIAQRYKRRAR